MAFEKIFNGNPISNRVVSAASPQNPQLGVDIDADTLWVNSGNGWVEVGTGNISGSGTTGFVPVFASSSSLGNSVLDYGVTAADTFTSTAPLVVDPNTINVNNNTAFVIEPTWNTTGVSGMGLMYIADDSLTGTAPQQSLGIDIDMQGVGTSNNWAIVIEGGIPAGSGNWSILSRSPAQSEFFGPVKLPYIQAHTVYSAAGTALPAAATAGVGARAFVSDATASTFGTAYTSGGTNKVPVYSDGTAWHIG